MDLGLAHLHQSHLEHTSRHHFEHSCHPSSYAFFNNFSWAFSPILYLLSLILTLSFFKKFLLNGVGFKFIYDTEDKGKYLVHGASTSLLSEQLAPS